MFKRFYSVTEALAWVGYIALAGIIIIVFIDGSGRYLFNHPMRGSNELVEVAMILLGGFAIMYTSVKQGHATVDFITARLSKRTQKRVRWLGSLLSLVTWMVVTYLSFQLALESPLKTASLRIPLSPLLLTFAVAMVFCVLALFVETLFPGIAEKNLKEGGENVP